MQFWRRVARIPLLALQMFDTSCSQEEEQQLPLPFHDLSASSQVKITMTGRRRRESVGLALIATIWIRFLNEGRVNTSAYAVVVIFWAFITSLCTGLDWTMFICGHTQHPLSPLLLRAESKPTVTCPHCPTSKHNTTNSKGQQLQAERLYHLFFFPTSTSFRKSLN